MTFDGNAHLSSDEKALIHAAKVTGDSAQVKRLLAVGISPDIRDGHNLPWDQTPLMLAAENAFPEIVQLLLDAGASTSTLDKNAAESTGENTPLHHAVKGQNSSIVEALLNAGADVNALNTDGDSPLNIAISRGNLPLARLLVQRGAPLAKFSRKRFNPPLYAFSQSQIKDELKLPLLNFLLQAGANPNETNHRRDTPLQRLAIGHDVENDTRLSLLSTLLKAGAIDSPDKDGGTALYTAAFYKNLRALQLLLDHGSNPNLLSPRGTLLDILDHRLVWARKDIDDPHFRAEFRPQRQQEIQELESFIAQLPASGAKRKSELPHEPLAPKSASTADPSAPKAKSPPLGLKHFTKLANDGESEWTLFAVLAPLDKVTEALTRRHKNAKLLPNVELKKSRANEELAPHIALIQIKDNPWTIILNTLYHITEAAINTITEDAQSLSQLLDTQAIAFLSEDTSGAMALTLFDHGAPSPKINGTTDEESAHKTLRKLGIYLPACYPKSSARATHLSIQKSSLNQIQNAHLLLP